MSKVMVAMIMIMGMGVAGLGVDANDDDDNSDGCRKYCTCGDADGGAGLVLQVPGLRVPEVQHGITVEDTGDPAAFSVDPKDREAWCMQFFRSIDTTSALGVPTTHDQAYSLGFSSGAWQPRRCILPPLQHACMLVRGRRPLPSLAWFFHPPAPCTASDPLHAERPCRRPQAWRDSQACTLDAVALTEF